MTHLLSRLGFYLLAALVSVTLNFLIPRMMPGDPSAAFFARFRRKLDPEAVAALKEALGYTDAPIWSQFATYIANVLQGNFGISVAYFPAPVNEVITEGLGWTLLLAGGSMVVSFVVGTTLGVIAAGQRGRWLDDTLPAVLALLGAFPYFWLAMAALYLFGFVLGWFPLRHAYSDDLSPAWTVEFIADVFRHVALPSLTIIVATLAGWTLSMRSTMIARLDSEAIMLARAKGLSSRRILLRYAARDALLPNVTGFGMALGFVLGGALLTEIVFSYPGTGFLLLQAVRNQDYPLMQGLFVMITLAVLGANLLVDVVYFWLDPRVRARGEQ